MKIFYLVLNNLQKKLNIMLEFSSMIFVYRYIHTLFHNLSYINQQPFEEKLGMYTALFSSLFVHALTPLLTSCVYSVDR